MQKLLIDGGIFDELVGKSVIINVQQGDDVCHVLGPITFLGMEKQKIGGLKIAPDKRLSNSKAYTPACFALLFSDNARLIFVEEDTKIVARHKGIRLLLDKTTVDMVEYTHELHNH
jgi:hypothetical protein